MKTISKQQILIISLSIISLCFITSTLVMNYKMDYERELHNKAYYNIQSERNLLRTEKEEYAERYTNILYELENEKTTQNKSINYPQIWERPSLYYKTLYPLDLKTEMTENCAVITTIPAGAKVEIINSIFGLTWEVRYNGNTGWVNANGTLEKI
jgi:hypothetical protein